jgi:hypothetical protein
MAMNIVTEIFELIADALGGFFTVISDGITSVTALFWVPATGFTLVGTLTICGLGVGLVWVLIRFVTGLVRGAVR